MFASGAIDHLPEPSSVLTDLAQVLRRVFGHRPLYGVEREDLVQESLCRLLQIRARRATSTTPQLALSVAALVRREALRQRCRDEARIAEFEDLDQRPAADGEMNTSALSRAELRAAIRERAHLSAHESNFLEGCLSGLAIEDAGARLGMNSSTSYYVREKILNKIRTTGSLRSLLQ